MRHESRYARAYKTMIRTEHNAVVVVVVAVEVVVVVSVGEDMMTCGCMKGISWQ